MISQKHPLLELRGGGQIEAFVASANSRKPAYDQMNLQ